MKRSSLVAAAILLSLSGAGRAQALPVKYTYTGFVSSGFDYTGVFGAVSADLTGLSFTVVETFDPTKAVGGNSGTDGATYSEGESDGAANAREFATSVITIGGQVLHISPVTYAESYNVRGTQNYSKVQSAIRTADYVKDEYTDFNTYSPFLSYDYTSAGVFDTTNAVFYGSFYDLVTRGSDTVQSAYANLDVSSLVISAVPLPSTAPMFGAALLTIAVVGRLRGRRRSSVAPVN